MKNLYFLLPAVLFSILATGCSSGSSSDSTPTVAENNCSITEEENPETGVCETKTCLVTETLNLETGVCETKTCSEGETLNAEGVCEAEVVEPDVCEEFTNPDGTCAEYVECQENSTLLEAENSCQCNDGFVDNSGVCEVEVVEPDVCEEFTKPDGTCEPYIMECQENASIIEAENVCKCDERYIEDANGECQIDFSGTTISGVVFDGLVAYATISVCEIVDGVKEERPEILCEDSNASGEFRCSVPDVGIFGNENLFIIKATGGIDLGVDGKLGGGDDKENRITTKSAIQGIFNTQPNVAVITPATSVLTYNMSSSNWTKDLEEVREAFKSATGFDLNETTLSETQIKSATLIAKIISVLPEEDREEVFVNLANEVTIFESDEVVSGLIEALTGDDETRDREEALRYQIAKIVANTESATPEEEVILKLRTFNLTLEKLLVLENTSPEIADNVDAVLENNAETSVTVLNFVADITETGSEENITVVAENLEYVLNQTRGELDFAKEVVSEMIENGESLTGDDLLSIVIERIELKKNPPCETGYEKDEEGNCIVIPDSREYMFPQIPETSDQTPNMVTSTPVLPSSEAPSLLEVPDGSAPEHNDTRPTTLEIPEDEYGVTQGSDQNLTYDWEGVSSI
jgi:hypothetical protein